MSERAAFLEAIEADPADDTRRLAFADYLDEQEDATDLDRSTAEFIRISCQSSGQGKCRQSKAEGKWLAANWGRLIPSVMVATRYKPRRTGRWLSLAAYVRGGIAVGRRPEMPLYVFARLEFWRGFLRRVLFDSAFELELLLPILVQDQPLAEPDLAAFPEVARQSADGEITSTIYGANMGAAFAFVRGGLSFRYRDDSHVRRFHNDPGGSKAREARRDAFRALAKSYALAPAV